MSVGLIGRLEYLEYLLAKYGEHESLDEVIYREVGPLRYASMWSKIVDRKEKNNEQDKGIPNNGATV